MLANLSNINTHIALKCRQWKEIQILGLGKNKTLPLISDTLRVCAGGTKSCWYGWQFNTSYLVICISL